MSRFQHIVDLKTLSGDVYTKLTRGATMIRVNNAVRNQGNELEELNEVIMSQIRLKMA